MADWSPGTAIMLKENPQKRPTIYEVMKEGCDMQGKEVPIRDVCLPDDPQQPRENTDMWAPRFTPIGQSPKRDGIRNCHQRQRNNLQ